VYSLNSPMSKSPDGNPFGPKMTFVGRGRSLSLMPIDLSSPLAICSDVIQSSRPADVHQNEIRQVLDSERDAVAAGLGLDGSEAGMTEHVARELQVLLVVVDDEHEFVRHPCIRCSRTGAQVSSRLIAVAEIRTRIRKGIAANAPSRS
jgi:hypothetical protein